MQDFVKQEHDVLQHQTPCPWLSSLVTRGISKLQKTSLLLLLTEILHSMFHGFILYIPGREGFQPSTVSRRNLYYQLPVPRIQLTSKRVRIRGQGHQTKHNWINHNKPFISELLAPGPTGNCVELIVTLWVKIKLLKPKLGFLLKRNGSTWTFGWGLDLASSSKRPQIVPGDHGHLKAPSDPKTFRKYVDCVGLHTFIKRTWIFEPEIQTKFSSFSLRRIQHLYKLQNYLRFCICLCLRLPCPNIYLHHSVKTKTFPVEFKKRVIPFPVFRKRQQNKKLDLHPVGVWRAHSLVESMFNWAHVHDDGVEHTNSCPQNIFYWFGSMRCFHWRFRL